MADIKQIKVGTTTYDIVDNNIGFQQILTSGTEIGKITIHGTTTSLYAPTDTDTKVTQTVTTTNSTYPLLFSATASASSTATTTSRFGTVIHANPATGRVAMRALVVGQGTTANYCGWTTTVPSSTTNAVTGQVMFVIGPDVVVS